MLRPEALASDRPHGPWSCRGRDIWDTITAAAAGDVPALEAALARDPDLHRAAYGYTQPLHFAVREGHPEAVRVLLAAGADPDARAPGGEDPVTVARDRGHEAVARLLEEARVRRARAMTDAARMDRALDVALWGRGADLEVARLLLERGAAYDLAVAAAFGDLERVRAILDEAPARITEARPGGRRALSVAVEGGHAAMARLLLERGADPNWPEGPDAPRGLALHLAARAGDRALVELLLAHGADPNAHVDSAGSATFAARTPALRELLITHGGALDPFDLVWLDEDDEALRRVIADPASADAGCGGVFAAACTLGKRELVIRLLAAGVRVPKVATGCRSYLMSDPELLRLLLEGGMDPDMPDWQHATPLHDLCARDGRGRAMEHRLACANLLLDAGATLSARDEEYRSTPLGWAARCDVADMVELLLARGAPVCLPDDPAWATPLAWATRRGNEAIAGRLRDAGATR